MNKSQYIRIKDAIAEFGPCRSIWYQLMGDGKIRAIKCGRSTLLDRASVEAYFASLPDRRAIA
jgi:hypothetical protein